MNFEFLKSIKYLLRYEPSKTLDRSGKKSDCGATLKKKYELLEIN
jgi:hypothetical protein